MLTQSVIPCADSISDNNANIEIAKTQSQPDQDHNDACSPLCQCSCCAGFSINHFIPSIEDTPLYISNPSCCFLSSNVIKIASSIWQPPQLV